MTEYDPSTLEAESDPKLERGAIISRLQELGADIEMEDWDGEDDNDVLGNIAGLAAIYDFELDDFLEAVGIPIESRFEANEENV